MKTIKSKKEFINLLKRIHEQDETALTAPTPPAPVAGEATPATTSASPDAEPITLDDIIEKLNIIRSGRSTKDDDVKSELENYVLQFSEEDKSSLLAFLDGLGRILTTEEKDGQTQAGSETQPAAPPPAPPTPKQSSTQAPVKSPAPAKSPTLPITAGGI